MTFAFAPMLAASAPANADTLTRLNGHYFDLKIDGVRGILVLNAGKVTIHNRNGVNITARYPELTEAAIERFGSTIRVILDGEIVVKDSSGRPSFKMTSKRDRQQKTAVIEALSKTMPATFITFDVLYHESADLRSQRWTERKELLDLLMQGEFGLIQANVGSFDGTMMLDMVNAYHLEGLVAKDPNSIYQAGRRSTWVKIKPTQTASFLVTGATRGTGARAETFGALGLAVLRQDGTLRAVGEVGSGFKQTDLIEVGELLANNTPFVVEVEFQEVTADGALRFPVFRGIRTDVELDACVEGQLQEYLITEQPA